MLVGIFVSSLVFSFELKQENFDVSIIPELEQSVSFPVTISGVPKGDYVIFTLAAVSLMPTDSFYLSGEGDTILVEVYPTDSLSVYNPTTYSFSTELRNIKTDKIYKGVLSVRAVRIENALSFYSDKNSPDLNEISFYVKNKEGIDLNGIKARFVSDFFDIEKTFSVRANSTSEIVIDMSREEMEKIEAGNYPLKVEIETSRGKRLLEGAVIFGEKLDIKTASEKKGFLIRKEIVSKKNYGSVSEEVVVEIKKDIFSKMFTSFNSAPDFTTRDGIFIKHFWKTRLGPSEELVVVSSTRNYLPLLIILALILIYVGIKRHMNTKLEVLKSVSRVKTSGGQFALKVRLKVRAKQEVTSVSLVDKIPGIVKIYDKQDSIIKPTKIDPSGKKIQWDIGRLADGEERSFSYTVYSKLGVVGILRLPLALAVFEKDGNIYEVESNEISFDAGPKK